MEMQNHTFDELTVIFSQERLDSYLTHKDCSNRKNDALIAYSWNIELSKTLYPALQILEIALRNSLHNAASESYQTESWFDLSFLHLKEQIKVIKAKDNLRREKKPIEAGRIVAELSFGFWTSLFDVRYEHNQVLWPRLLKPVFPFFPKSQRTRSNISRELNRIRRLRNRVFHYEPIWHWQDLVNQHSCIINLVRGLSLFAAEYLTLFDQFKEIHTNGKDKIKSRLTDI